MIPLAKVVNDAYHQISIKRIWLLGLPKTLKSQYVGEKNAQDENKVKREKAL